MERFVIERSILDVATALDPLHISNSFKSGSTNGSIEILFSSRLKNVKLDKTWF